MKSAAAAAATAVLMLALLCGGSGCMLACVNLDADLVFLERHRNKCC